MTEIALYEGLITIRDEEGSAFVDLAVEALESVKADFPWDGRGSPKQGLLTHRAEITFVEEINNPAFAEGKYSFGDGYHHIKIIRKRKNGKPAANKIRYYTLHELTHALDHDSLTKADKTEIRATMDPYPEGWGDTKGGDPYWHLPSESYPNRLVEAMVVKSSEITSPFDDDYTRKISDAELDTIYAITLAGHTHTGENPEEPEEIPEPPKPDYPTIIAQAIAALEPVATGVEDALVILEGGTIEAGE